MNNIKKTVLGMVIAALAFGISAYTTVRNGTVLRYYKTDTEYPEVDDPRGYQYYSGDRCEAGGSLCSALWNLGTNTLPDEGDELPSSGVTLQPNSVISGHFE